MTHRRRASPLSPNSSPHTASSGRASARRRRSDSSTARSASLSGVRSGLVSTTRSAAPNRPDVMVSAASARVTASARSSSILTDRRLPRYQSGPALTHTSSLGVRGVLRLRLLGDFAVEVDGREVPDAAWRRRKARTLVKLLALAPERTLHRDQLIEAMWPDAASGAN